MERVGTGRRTISRARVAPATVAIALSLAVGGALRSDPAAGLPLAVASIAGHLTAWLEANRGALPRGGYAFAAGMAAALNPCGFALLPAYLGLFLGTGDARAGPRAIGRALRVGVTMTAGFVALFGLVGLALGVGAGMLSSLLPWVSLLIGVALTVLGGRMLAGGGVRPTMAGRLGDRLGTLARRADPVGYAAYGVAFALASLGCALPLFLTVVATALTGGGLGAATTQFVLYALGMGLVVTGATVLVAQLEHALVARAGAAAGCFETGSALLLLVSGAYVVYYWLAVGGLLG